MLTPDAALPGEEGSGRNRQINCPYPDCQGKIEAFSESCPTCQQSLALCRQCGQLMARQLGFCDYCGSSAEAHSSGERIAEARTNAVFAAESVAESVAPELELGYGSLLQLIAEAYYEAALAEENMRAVTDTLESLRAAVADEQSHYRMWDKFDEQIGRSADKHLQQLLGRLRARFEEKLRATEIARLTAAFKKDPEKGWTEWLRAYAEALTEWRVRFARYLADARFPFAGARAPFVEKIRRATFLVSHERWAETLDLFTSLAAQGCLPELQRARLFVIAAQIQLYHFMNPEKARELFETAEALAPTDERVICGMGEYWLKQDTVGRARERAERALTAARPVPHGYSLMGECFEKQGDLDAAEEWYEKAIRTAPGYTSGYEKLMGLCGRPERFPTQESRIPSLLDTIIAIASWEAYGPYLEMGAIYQRNAKYEEAQSWYDRAIALDGSRLGGYTAKGYAYLEEEDYEHARATFEKAIEVAPESFDGHWGMSFLYEQQEQWEEAIRAYEQSLALRPEWDGIIRGKIAELKLKLNRHEEVEKEYLEMLRREPEDQVAFNALHVLADSYYKERGAFGSALRVYEEILAIKGDSYQASYHNRVGNMRYFQEDYAAAAESYLRAIDADPDTAVYRSNLLGAYRELKQWDRAREYLEASRRDHKGDGYEKELASIDNAEANELFDRGEFQRAIEKYEEAIRYDPASAVYYSNLSYGWENLKVPGERLEALARAVEAIRRARALEPNNREYADKLGYLESRRRLASKYGEQVIDRLLVVTPMAMEVAGDLIPHFEGSAKNALSEEALRHVDALKERVFGAFGVQIPGLRFRGNVTGDLPPGSYIIMLMEVPLVMGAISLEKRFTPESAERLAAIDVAADAAADPSSGESGFWVAREDWAKVEAAGLRLWELVEYPVRHLEGVIRKNLVDFVGHQEVSTLLESVKTKNSFEVRRSPEKLTALTQVLRALVAEEVPITSLERICERFSELSTEGMTLTAIAEELRSMPEIIERLPGNSDRYSFYRLSPEFEVEMARSIYDEDGQAFLAMEPENCQRALAALHDDAGHDKHAALVVAKAELRPHLRKLTELEFPNVPVLSRQELLPALAHKVAGVVTLN